MLSLEQTLVMQGENLNVSCLLVFGSRLICGAAVGSLQVMNVFTGNCDQILLDQTSRVVALAKCRRYLVSCSQDKIIKVYMRKIGPVVNGDARQLVCVKTLQERESFVQSLAVWQDRTVVGMSDSSIRLLNIIEDHVTNNMLNSYGNGAYELLVHRDRLFSASRNGLIEVWDLATLDMVFTVQGYNRIEGLLRQQYSQCLAISGTKLISGSVVPAMKRAEVQVWDLETMHQEHTINALGSAL